MGITTYIKKALMPGKEFKVGGPVLSAPAGKLTTASEKGLYIGRATDTELQRFYTGKLPRRRLKDPRAIRIIDHISKTLKLKVVAAQLPVTLEEFKLKTSIDLVAEDAARAVHVLEIKTTQFRLAEHNLRYKRLCIGAPMLKNGVQNSESGQYSLQTGFGMAGISRLIPPTVPVKGRIIVATCDAVQSYGCPAVFTKPSLFSIPIPASAQRSTAVRAKAGAELISLPEAPEDHHRFVKEIAGLGYTQVWPQMKTDVSFVASSSVLDADDDAKYAAVAIIHDPKGSGTTSAKYKRARELAVLATLKLRKKLKAPVQPLVLCYNSTEGTITRHAVRCPA